MSRDAKVHGHEPLRIHPRDAEHRSLADGDVARVWNARGATLVGVVVDEGIRPGVVELATGAWYDPADPTDPDSLDLAGNPNVLTRDVGTSGLAQGPSAHTCLVRVEPWTGPQMQGRAGLPPAFET
jgi:biotin/methionine sulfoxide reductase